MRSIDADKISACGGLLEKKCGSLQHTVSNSLFKVSSIFSLH